MKLDEINSESLKQLEGYLERRNELFERSTYDIDKEITKSPNWIGVLVGKTISKELKERLSQGIELDIDNIKIPIAGITINRYRNSVTSEIYVITDTYFKFSSTNKDYTKYKFNGNDYNKGQLVNIIIKDYVAKNPKITFAELEKVFPKSLQGSQGCFQTLEYAEEVFNRTARKRNKLNPEDLIQLSDCVIATSTQWYPDNIGKFINNAKKLKYNISKSN